MAKFNHRSFRELALKPDTVTYEGGAGYTRSAKQELFLLAVSNMVNEKTFYEGPADRDTRYSQLIHKLAVEDPNWTARLLIWLRSDANMRSASLVGAVEYVRARLAVGAPVEKTDITNREVISSVLQRADEPGEMIAYCFSTGEKKLPKPIKRGIGDAVRRLYKERSFLKWDSNGKAVRFGDVLELTHPSPVDARQGLLFKHAIDVRHNRTFDSLLDMPMLLAREHLMAIPVEKRREYLTFGHLASAGMTWESVAGWLQSPMDQQVWEAVIPSMGYMAQLRNLRNFDQAGVSDAVASQIATKLANPNEVANSRQLPFRFLSAYRATSNLRWAWVLEQALNHSLLNIPELPGRTLILIDTSGSMTYRQSERTQMSFMDSAILFGIAMGQRCESADVVSFSSGYRAFNLNKGESLLKAFERFGKEGLRFNNGTYLHSAMNASFNRHDRVIVVTDEQAHDSYNSYDFVGKAPIYTWNLVGYRQGTTPQSGKNYTFGGLTDQAFRMIPLLEAGQREVWPF